MVYIYQSEEYEEVVQRDIDDLKRWDKIEDRKNIATYSPFYIFTNRYENYKLIFEKSEIVTDNDTHTHIYILREFIPFGKKWNRTRKLIASGYYDRALEDQKVKAKKEFLRKKETFKKPIVPNSLLWFDDTLISGYKFNVYETQTWVKAYEKIDGEQKDIFRIIQKVLQNDIRKISVNSEKKIFKAVRGQLYIIYHQRNNTAITLITIGKLEENDEKDKLKLSKTIDTKITTKAYSISIPLKEEDIGKGFTFWNNNIQKTSKSSNLALHEEQIIFLKEKYNPPVFINGQAGSGKSTMLYYLVSDLIINRYLEKKQQNEILFLTENQALLEESKSQIKLLLKNNLELAILSDDEIQENEPDYFSFQELIISKLLDENEQEDFNESRFIDFSETLKITCTILTCSFFLLLLKKKL